MVQQQAVRDLAEAGHYQHSRLSHLFDGGAKAFASEARVFDSAEGHGVETPTRGVADDESADLEFTIGSEDKSGIAGEKAGLKAVPGVIDLGQGLLKVVVRLDDDDRAEDLFIAHLHSGLGSSENDRSQDGTAALAAGNQLCAALDGLPDPSFNTIDLGNPDERAYFGCFIGGIAGDQMGGVLDDLPQKGLKDGALESL